MAFSLSGSVSMNSYLATAFTAPAGGSVLTPYQIPVNIAYSQSYTDGSGASQSHKIIQAGGNSSSATTYDIFATTYSAGPPLTLICTDGSYGLTYVREFILFNDSSTSGQYLKFDLTTANAFGPHATPGSGFIEGTMTTVKIDLHPGSFLHWSAPLTTAGVVVDNTHKIIALDPVGVAVPWRLVIVGG